MNDGAIEAIIREMAPDYAKKVLLAGTEEYTSLVLVWEEDGRSGTTLINLFDEHGEPVGAYSVSESDVRRGMRVVQQMREVLLNPKSHPTRVIVVDN